MGYGEDILHKLRKITDLWFLEFAASNLHHNPALWYRLEMFGSAALGTEVEGSDLDFILVVPAHTSRHDFFYEFNNLVKNFGGATNIVVVSNTNVPLLSFYMVHEKVNVDICFVSINWPYCPTTSDLVSDELLNFVMDKRSQSLQGYRVAHMIPKIMGNKMGELQQLTKFVKRWAQNRLLYGSLYGYLGGISWTIIVAKYLSLNEKYRTRFIDFLLHNCFSMDELPRKCITLTGDEGATDGHIFPILNPVFPFNDSAYNLTISTFWAIHRELEVDWGKNDLILMDASDFDTKLGTHYIVLEFSNTSVLDGNRNGCNGYLQRIYRTIESKLKYFIYALEKLAGTCEVVLNYRIRPIPRRFIPQATNSVVARYFIALTLTNVEILDEVKIIGKDNMLDIRMALDTLQSAYNFQQLRLQPTVRIIKKEQYMDISRS